MCGITGYCTFSNDNSYEQLESIINKMSDSLSSRGPDDKGFWIDSNKGIALGHRRLSILDLSSSGHQPMVSNNQRYIISFNGEIYNFKDLKTILINKGYNFKSNTDTEVMLMSFEEWGVKDSLQRFDGMFAFVVWDRNKNEFWLARDKIGEKPLYYGFQNQKFFFGSELKSIHSNSFFKPVVDKDALSMFLKYSYVPSPLSIYKGIKKLQPGHYVNLKDPFKIPNPKPFWDIIEITKTCSNNIYDGIENDAIDHLESILKKSIESRMVSDVSIGAFLSGGIDSSTIVSIMQKVSNKPINTFTIGFKDQKYNEALKAKKIANHLKTNHTELYVSNNDLLNVIPDLSNIYDEPFADSSQIPTTLISGLAKKNVTVALTGDGGDELFGGYNRYFLAQKYWSIIKLIPFIFRKYISKSIESIPNNYISNFENIFFGNSNYQITNKFYKIGNILKQKDLRSTYNRLVSIIDQPNDYLTFNNQIRSTINNAKEWNLINDKTMIMQFLDLTTYLPDDILVKVDRAAMISSLETRVPFLSPEVIKFALSLPKNFKYRNNEGKWILRELLYRHVPKKIISGPKIGFGIPLKDWLKNTLKDWSESLISNNVLKEHNYFNVNEIQKMWNLHQSGKFDYSSQIWNIIMFQSWYQKWMKK